MNCQRYGGNFVSIFEINSCKGPRTVSCIEISRCGSIISSWWWMEAYASPLGTHQHGFIKSKVLGHSHAGKSWNICIWSVTVRPLVDCINKDELTLMHTKYHTHCFMWVVINHPCRNFDGGLTTASYKLYIWVYMRIWGIKPHKNNWRNYVLMP